MKQERSTGVTHWLLEHITGFFVIPVTCWFIAIFLPELILQEGDLEKVLNIGHNRLGAILWTLTLFYYGCLNMQTIFEDYLKETQGRSFWIWSTYLFSGIIGFWTIFKLL